MSENEKLSPMHKAAFRTAYELLQETWPPIASKEFVVTAVAKADKRYNDSRNELARKLINAVLDYLESEIVKMGGIR